MKIYFNGDSHTCGSELIQGEGYSYKLAELLNADIMDNPAIGGASNDRILRTTERDLYRWIETGDKPDLVVIGWSEFRRFDWFHEGQYKSVRSEELDTDTCNDINPERLEYTRFVLGQTAAISFYTRLYHDKFYNLHEHLSYHKIPHLFFSAVESLKTSLLNHIEECVTQRELDTGKPTHLYEYDWNGSYYHPYLNQSSFLEWGINQGYKATYFNHLEASAHTEYATILKDYLLENSIIS